MRLIRDNNPPEALLRCMALRRDAGQALDYDEVGQVDVSGTMVSVKAEIRKARLMDQGAICAYTMMRIDVDTCHNEHVIPRTVSKKNGRVEETLDYRNIVACYPKREVKGGCGFGAAARGEQPLELTPFDSACESRIKFDRASGNIAPSNPGDERVRTMIDDVLMLNHSTLVSRRLTAFEKAAVGTRCKKPLSAPQARALAKSVLEFRRGTQLTPFCVAVSQAALAHAEVIEKRARRHSAGN